MDIVLGLLIVALVLYYFLGKHVQKSPSVPSPVPVSREQDLLSANSPWLEARWQRARAEKSSGNLISVPSWFFDDATERQVQRLRDIGITVRGEKPLKGEASDIIGLFEPVEDGNKEILRFFKIPLSGMNQSRARHEVGQLLRDPENMERWKCRPPSDIQREFYRFFDIKVPKDLTYERASVFINEYVGVLDERGDSRAETWDTFATLYEEINDPEIRAEYGLRKVGISLYRSAIDQLEKEGRSLPDLVDDSEAVLEKITEIKSKTPTQHG